MVISEYGVFEIVDECVKVSELAPEISIEEVRDKSQAEILS